MSNLHKSYSTLFFLLAFFISNGQNPLITGEKPIKLEIIDGSYLIGKIQDYNDSTIVIKSDFYDLVTIKINYIRKIKNFRSGGYMPINNYNSAHYFANPSGYGIKKGEQYYQNIGLALNHFAFGITDYFSISVGTEIISLLNGLIPITYISPKISIPIIVNNEIIGAFGVSSTFAIYDDNSYSSDNVNFANFFHQTFTLGNRNQNISIGFGIIGSKLFDENRRDDNKVYSINLSAIHPVGEKTSFVTDNTYVHVDFHNKYFLLSTGFRFHFKKRNGSMDLGFWSNAFFNESGGIPIAPFFSFTKILKTGVQSDIERSILFGNS